MQKMILVIFVYISVGISRDENYVLMVSFDGFRYDYTSLAETPNFDKLAARGVKADGLIPVFPSLTFPNHYSIATGAYAGTHNITGNSFYDKKYGKKYSLYDRDTVRDPKFYKAEPIWVTAERQGVQSASYYWVGTEAPVKGHSPSILKYYDGSVAFKARIDSVISWFQLQQKPRLIMLYFSEPDHTGHDVGVSHPDILTSVVAMDSLLGYLMESLEKLEIYDKLNMFVVSDHGMVDVSNKRMIILDDYIIHMAYIVI
jgi:alkaline phosphatase D